MEWHRHLRRRTICLYHKSKNAAAFKGKVVDTQFSRIVLITVLVIPHLSIAPGIVMVTRQLTQPLDTCYLFFAVG